MRPGLTGDSGGDISDAGRNTKYEARIWYIINIMMETLFNPVDLSYEVGRHVTDRKWRSNSRSGLGL